LSKRKALQKQDLFDSAIVKPLLKLSVKPSCTPSSISLAPPPYICTTPGFHDNDMLLDMETPSDNISPVEVATVKLPADSGKQAIEQPQGSPKPTEHERYMTIVNGEITPPNHKSTSNV